MLRVAESEEETQISAEVIDYQIQFKNEVYDESEDGPIPLGEFVTIDILSVGPVEEYHIHSCVANNKRSLLSAI